MPRFTFFMCIYSLDIVFGRSNRNIFFGEWWSAVKYHKQYFNCIYALDTMTEHQTRSNATKRDLKRYWQKPIIKFFYFFILVYFQ